MMEIKILPDGRARKSWTSRCGTFMHTYFIPKHEVDAIMLEDCVNGDCGMCLTCKVHAAKGEINNAEY